MNQTSSEGHEILVKKETCLLEEQMLYGQRKIIKYIHGNLQPLTTFTLREHIMIMGSEYDWFAQRIFVYWDEFRGILGY